MLMLVNGRQVDVPADSDGSVNSEILRHTSGIEADRVLLQRKPDGGNYVINPNDRIYAGPLDHFDSAPAHKRG